MRTRADPGLDRSPSQGRATDSPGLGTGWQAAPFSWVEVGAMRPCHPTSAGGGRGAFTPDRRHLGPLLKVPSAGPHGGGQDSGSQGGQDRCDPHKGGQDRCDSHSDIRTGVITGEVGEVQSLTGAKAPAQSQTRRNIGTATGDTPLISAPLGTHTCGPPSPLTHTHL